MKTAVVLGGGTGIGLATSLRLAEEGYEVAAAGLEQAPDFPNHVQFRECDACSGEALKSLFGDMERLDALVNCAGIIRHQAEWETDTFRTVVDVNLTASFEAAHLAWPKLQVTGGSVVNVASMWSYFGSPTAPAYTASKGAVAALTRSLAAAWGPQGVRVNAVAPGWVDTQLAAAAKADAIRGPQITQRIPLGRWALPDEIASVIVFLLSKQASYVNGAVIPVDGGYSIA